MTIKMYETDSMLYEFDAQVLSCRDMGDGVYEVELDQSAFFPEGGGQDADTGTLDEARVTDVQLRGDIVVHRTNAPFAAGQRVHGAIDQKQRFCRMQHHTGEHILSGTLHRLYGVENVGFHMGAQDVTIDTNIPLTREQIICAEREANRIVFSNARVHAYYPDAQELESLTYRSKKQIEGAARIVDIEGCDRCACCAPHLARTGQVGYIKVLDAIHYKGGMRLHLLCGEKAAEDHEQKYIALSAIAASLSVKQTQAAEAVSRMQEELAHKNGELRRMSRELAAALAQNVPQTDGHLCVFAPLSGGDALREFVLRAKDKCTGVCVVFSENPPHLFAAASDTVPLGAFIKEMNDALSGRGGGAKQLAQGSVQAQREQIERFFAQKNALTDNRSDNGSDI